MRKVSNYPRKIEQFLEKSLGHYKNGFARSFNLEIAGVRFRGELIKDLKLEDGVLSFAYGEENLSLSVEQITKFKRLRTKKYLFFVEGESEEPKKPAKKKPAKKKKKEEDETKQEDKE